jgi:hypothetical protein
MHHDQVGFIPRMQNKIKSLPVGKKDRYENKQIENMHERKKLEKRTNL